MPMHHRVGQAIVVWLVEIVAAAAAVEVEIVAVILAATQVDFHKSMNTTQNSIPTSLAYAVLILVVSAMVYFYWHSHQGPRYRYTAQITPVSVLEKNNEAFRQAQAASRLGNYSDALSLYQASLQKAQDDVQRSQIQYKVALTKDSSGAVLDAIALYKDLVSDQATIPQVRAYAAYRLARMYVVEPRDDIYNAIFDSGAPYAAFVVANDREATIKNLAEYAATLQPLALPELYGARWYANQIVRAKNKEIILTNNQKAEYQTMIQQKLEAARVEVTRMMKDQNESSLVPSAVALEAQIRSQLYFVGADTEKNARDVYDRSLQLSSVYNQPGEDGFIRLRYAIFLAKIDAKRNANAISTLLAPLYTDLFLKTRFSKYLAALPSARSSVYEYDDIVTFAKNNPAFKALLIKTGWDASLLQ